jgi:hypothetical protein
LAHAKSTADNAIQDGVAGERESAHELFLSENSPNPPTLSGRKSEQAFSSPGSGGNLGAFAEYLTRTSHR